MVESNPQVSSSSRKHGKLGGFEKREVTRASRPWIQASESPRKAHKSSEPTSYSGTMPLFSGSTAEDGGIPNLPQ